MDNIDISFIKGATKASSRPNDKINKVSKGRVSDADYAVEGFNLAKKPNSFIKFTSYVGTGDKRIK